MVKNHAVYKESRVYTEMKVDAIARWINNSKTTQKVLRAVSDNPALASAGISFIAASFMRPMAQAALPIKNKDDKRYTIASSVATGVTELGLACLMFIPVNKLIQKVSRNLYSSSKETIYKENPLLLRQFKSITNRGFKLLTLPLTSALRFAAITPFVKLLFGKNKTKTVSATKGGKLNYEG